MKTHILPTKAVTLSLFIVSTMAGLILSGLSGSMSAPDSATLGAIASSQRAPRTTAQVREAYGQIPLSFEANRGQADESVNFRARGAGYILSLSPTEVVLTLAPRSDEPSPAVLQMSLVGGNSGAAVEGVNELQGKVNYFIGNDPARWRTNVPTFGRVRYTEVYPGIDVVYYGNQRRLEYDFVVRPGRDARAIALEFAGAERVEVEAGTGDLLLGVGEKTIRQHKPVVYQEIAGGRREVEGRYAMRSGGRVGFEVGKYDPSAALIIDPVLEYSTYLGGSSDDAGNGIAVDSAGNAYVTGSTASTGFPTVNALQSTRAGPVGSRDAFVTKINAAGSAIVYSTYLGGNSGDDGYGISVDSAGNAYVVGTTASSDFPTANAFQNTHGGATFDVFVTKLNSTGSALVYSSYLGGSGDDLGDGIAVDSAGNAYVTGSTRSNNFPIASAFQSTRASGAYNAFITKFNAAGSALVYSTYLGGGGSDQGFAIAVDSAGNAYVVGSTDSTNFPTANAFQNTFGGGFDDVFVTKLNATGSALVYSSYLGGSSDDLGDGIAVDSAGNAYVTGLTDSSCFPTTTGAFDTTSGGGTDVFISKISETAPPLALTPCPSQLLNIATRMRVLTGDSALIGGFIITGSDPKQVIIRGIGPSLTGIQDALANPTLELLDANQTSLASNDDWKSNQAEVEGTTIPPTNDFESAIVKTLNPGAYTAVLRGKDNSSGIGVVEVYDLNADVRSTLANISSRGFVDAGDNAMIAGLIVGGSGQADAKIVIRGIGPSLSGFGITGALQDPTLDVKDTNGATLLSNDDWQQGQPMEITQLGLAPSDSREAALLISLPHGIFTAVLRGKSNTIGVAVVEIYNVP